MDIPGEEIVGTFYEKELQKTNKKEFRIEKIIKKGDKLYLKWKVYDNVFNRCIDKKKTQYKYNKLMNIFQNQIL